MFLPRKSARGRRVRKTSAPRACLGIELLETRTVPYALSGNAWAHPELVTISFVPDGTDLGGVSSNLIATLNARYSPSYWQSQFLKAAQVWAQQTNLNFALKSDSGAPIGNGSYQQGSPSFGDIRIGGYNFGSTTLARAYLPPQVNNFSIASDFQFNTGQSWVIGTAGGYDLFTVAMHEFGHALGLLHSASYYAAMYPSYQGARTGLGADDVNAIRAAYSSGQARAHDSYDTGGGNGALSTATLINSLINPGTLTGLVTDRDITTSTDVDYFRFNVPSGTNGTMTVKLQSQGLSQLEPYLMLYNAAQQVISYTDTTGTYGTTLTTTITGMQAGQTYFIRAGGDDSSSPFGTGKYALSLNFGSDPSPTVSLPNTLTLNGTPLSSGGGTPVEDGLEYRVNTTTQGTQTTDRGFAGQATAMDAAGNYVVTWSSNAQDGNGWGVYAQQYNSAGEAMGGEFQVNTTTSNDQTCAVVAMDAAGNFIITWSSNGQDGGGWGIYAQRFDAAGVAQGGEFQVATTSAGDQTFPSIAMDAEGDFVITWASQGQDGGGWGVYGQRYRNDGEALGGEFRVNTFAAGDQTSATVAMDQDGDFVVTWSSEDDSGWGVYAQRYDAAGAAQGSEFRVNTTTANDQMHATVGMNAAGSFVVTWSSKDQDGDGWGVYGQRYDAAGSPQGGEFRVNTNTDGDQLYPAVTLDSRDHLMVTWSSDGQDGDGWGVYGQRFDLSGEAVGDELFINTTTAGHQGPSSVSSSDYGNFVVVWSGNGPGDDQGVFAQRYVVYAGDDEGGVGEAFHPDGCVEHDHPGDSDGVAVGDEFLVATTDMGGAYAPSVGSSSGWDTVVVGGGGYQPDANLLTGLGEDSSDDAEREWYLASDAIFSADWAGQTEGLGMGPGEEVATEGLEAGLEAPAV